MLNDSNWKVRVEGMDKVKAIINDAKYVTPDLGDLPTCLAARLTESNKNLVCLFTEPFLIWVKQLSYY